MIARIEKLEKIAKAKNIPVDLLKYEIERKPRYGRRWIKEIEKDEISLDTTNNAKAEIEPIEIEEIHLLIEWGEYEKEEYKNFPYEIGEILEVSFYKYTWSI